MGWRFEGLRRYRNGVTRNDGSRVMCQRCGAEKVEAGRRGRSSVATWQGERVEEDGRRTYVAYCDTHFHWWNEKRLAEWKVSV